MSTFGHTRSTKQAMDFITAFVAANGFSPSYMEIKAALGLGSTSEASRIVGQLAERGHIRVLPRCSRSIEIIRHACPHCGGALDGVAAPHVEAPAPEHLP